MRTDQQPPCGPGPMDDRLMNLARKTKGFMPDGEGLALYAAALSVASHASKSWVEVGAYCGKSTVYLGAAAKSAGAVLFSVDHHNGSEENQPGWEHHDPALVDEGTGRMDTLPSWRRTINEAGLGMSVVGVIGESSVVSAHWAAPLAFVLIDGGHGEALAWADLRGWAPLVATGGVLAIHDVFEDPSEGGRPPYDIWKEALATGLFAEAGACGSLRLLRRIDSGADWSRQVRQVREALAPEQSG